MCLCSVFLLFVSSLPIRFSPSSSVSDQRTPPPQMSAQQQMISPLMSKFRGCFLGGLVGDCLGSPFEDRPTVSNDALKKFLAKQMEEQSEKCKCHICCLLLSADSSCSKDNSHFSFDNSLSLSLSFALFTHITHITSLPLFTFSLLFLFMYDDTVCYQTLIHSFTLSLSIGSLLIILFFSLSLSPLPLSVDLLTLVKGYYYCHFFFSFYPSFSLNLPLPRLHSLTFYIQSFSQFCSHSTFSTFSIFPLSGARQMIDCLLSLLSLLISHGQTHICMSLCVCQNFVLTPPYQMCVFSKDVFVRVLMAKHWRRCLHLLH